ncbi:MAG: LysM peptidoglycan-binding domain-containing protein [Anaerolineales bacterium]|nr:LysM peptidoglycan-binding domain-containing protein [Anaerolineales bacterium]
MKIPRWIAVVTAVSLLAVVALATSALTYRVQYGDTLSALAWRYGTSVGAIAATNHIANPDLIYAGQTLEIPAGEVYAAQHGNTAIQAVPVYQSAPAQHYVSTYPVAPASSTQVLRSGGTACARFNFETGRDSFTGSRQAGTYIMRQTTGEDLISWFARTGDKDSGWFNGIALSFEAVHITVTFYPADGGPAIPMQIVNHAPDTSAGWLARDMCHAIEIQFP